MKNVTSRGSIPIVAQRFDGDVDVVAVAAAHHDDLDVAKLAAALGLHHQLQRAPIALRSRRKSDAHDVHADRRQRLGNLELLRAACSRRPASARRRAASRRRSESRVGSGNSTSRVNSLGSRIRRSIGSRSSMRLLRARHLRPVVAHFVLLAEAQFRDIAGKEQVERPVERDAQAAGPGPAAASGSTCARETTR